MLKDEKFVDAFITFLEKDLIDFLPVVENSPKSIPLLDL